MMGWLIDLINALLGRRAPATGAPVVLPSDEAASFAIPLAQMRAAVVASGCALDRVDGVTEAFVKAFVRFGEARPLVIAHILVHCSHESWRFTTSRENLYYSTVQRIVAVFGGNRAIANAGPALLATLVENPEGLANLVYDDANRDPKYRLGNTEPGDGYRYRGHWWPQLTGKTAITMFARYLGMDPEVLVTRDNYELNALAALWFALVYKQGFASAALADNLPATTRIWNGGQIGLADRAARLPAVKQALGV